MYSKSVKEKGALVRKKCDELKGEVSSIMNKYMR